MCSPGAPPHFEEMGVQPRDPHPSGASSDPLPHRDLSKCSPQFSVGEMLLIFLPRPPISSEGLCCVHLPLAPGVAIPENKASISPNLCLPSNERPGVTL